MNYLAHAFLSPPDPVILMGNLWGDLVRPVDFPNLVPDLIKGVMQHKHIDAFTDQHENVNQMNMLIRPYQGKYTPVVTDVLMDFILSKYWHVFHEESLETFCEHVYAIVHTHLHLIPEKLHFRIGRMLDNRWLESCKSRMDMQTTLLMLSRRASFKNNIQEAMTPYELNEHTIDRLFLTFFDDLRKEVTLRNEG